MNMGKNKMKFAVRAVLAAAFAAVLAGCGCSDGGKGQDAPETVEQDPVKRRMNDPKYVAKIEKNIAAQREIMKKMDALKKDLDKAMSAGAAEKEIEALKEKIASGLKEMEKVRQEAVAEVRSRILADTGTPAPSASKKN